MQLPEALRRQKEAFLRKAPPQVAAALEKASADLARCGLVENCLQPGQKAPDFTLPDDNGVAINLYENLDKGPVVVNFFRGDW